MSSLHVYSRAPQCCMYRTGADTVAPSLKPGQLSVHRQGLWGEMALSARGGDRRAQAMPQASEYTAAVVEPSRTEEHAEARVEGLERVKRMPSKKASKRPGGAALWQTEFSAACERTMSDPLTHQIRVAGAAKGERPEPIHSTGAMEMLSSFGHDFGSHGLAGPGSARLTTTGRGALAAGTTKATGHVPGYQGFLPASARGHKLSTDPRQVNKCNITDVVRLRPVGYSGHVPQSARLAMSEFDCGGVTTSARDFKPNSFV